VARSLPAEELAGLRAQFHAIDSDGDGRITLDELRTCMRNKQSAVPEQQLQVWRRGAATWLCHAATSVCPWAA
jgi:Ca2+-binding EF-hand superfamily protein